MFPTGTGSACIETGISIHGNSEKSGGKEASDCGRTDCVQEMAAPSKMIRAALDYINAHFHENISLMDVAENINISKNYLCDIFKKELGVTFINYVTNLRIEKAKEYLTGTDMKMYEVSNAVGYNDYAYFSQIFKKHTGKTLSSYRKKK